MRRSKITPELIELSKRAKELGFPQDMEEGDWFYYIDTIFLADADHLRDIRDSYFGIGETTLILSFSRCLEWLRERGYLYFDCLNHPDNTWSGLVAHPPKGKEDFVISPSKTHHELSAKAVVKILEGD